MNRDTTLLLTLAFFAVGYPVCLANGQGKTRGSTASIAFTRVPVYGSFEDLEGRVVEADPQRHAVAVYIKVDGGWWIKPHWEKPLTKIQADGSWVCDITTGGADETATEITAYLLPAGYQPPLAAGLGQLPREIDEHAVAKAAVQRSRDERERSAPQPRANEVTRSGLPSDRVINGFCYGPFREKENPDAAVLPTASEAAADMKLIRKLTPTIRTYGCAGTLATIPEYCQIAGVECYVGAWLGRYRAVNDKEIETIIAIAHKNLPCVKALVVGNEVLLRGDLTEDELIAYIRRVKSATNLPVTTAEIWPVWQNHPRLAEEVDFIMVHIHPYWENVPIGVAVPRVLEHWRSLRKQFPGKRVVVGETGWPSAGQKQGEAVPSAENQAVFYKEFTALAKAEGIDYFYFEVFDERWKDAFEGGAGGYWGIFNSDGSAKSHMKELIPLAAAMGISRPPRKLEKVKATAPLFVYKDAGADENGFYPSGWMGDRDCIQVDDACTVKPHSGKTCVAITYDISKSPRVRLHTDEDGHPAVEYVSSVVLWAGVYWQFPLNNWGDYPGYELAGVTKVTFWGRGKNGGERAIFKCGGVHDPNKPYKDSFGPVSTTVELTNEWRKYTIDLSGQDTSSVIGGFCWTVSLLAAMSSTDFVQDQSWTIYLDDIVFEGKDDSSFDPGSQLTPEAEVGLVAASASVWLAEDAQGDISGATHAVTSVPERMRAERQEETEELERARESDEAAEMPEVYYTRGEVKTLEGKFDHWLSDEEYPEETRLPTAEEVIKYKLEHGELALEKGKGFYRVQPPLRICYGIPALEQRIEGLTKTGMLRHFDGRLFAVAKPQDASKTKVLETLSPANTADHIAPVTPVPHAPSPEADFAPNSAGTRQSDDRLTGTCGLMHRVRIPETRIHYFPNCL